MVNRKGGTGCEIGTQALRNNPLATIVHHRIIWTSPYEIGARPLFFTMNSPSPIDVTTTMPDLKNG